MGCAPSSLNSSLSSSESSIQSEGSGLGRHTPNPLSVPEGKNGLGDFFHQESHFIFYKSSHFVVCCGICLDCIAIMPSVVDLVDRSVVTVLKTEYKFLFIFFYANSNIH